MSQRVLTSIMRLYHNPRCSKSRQALALLQERGVEVEVYRYLDEGIDASDLHLLASLEGIVRSKDAGKAIMATLVRVEDTVALHDSAPSRDLRRRTDTNWQVYGKPFIAFGC